MKGEESPLKEHFDHFDAVHKDWGYQDYVNYVIDNQPNLTGLFYEDMKWRAKNKQNIIGSVEGDQGSGKSLFISSACIYTSKIFGKPFYDPEDINVLKKYLSFDPFTFEKQVSTSGVRETFLNDEYSKLKHGFGVNIVKGVIAQYEDQLRKDQDNMYFSSPELQRHSHFFQFEIKHNYYNSTKEIVAILKTRRYTSRNEFVWRGYVSFPVPPDGYRDQYELLKDEHLNRVKKKFGTNTPELYMLAEKVEDHYGDELIKESAEGFIRGLSNERLMRRIKDVIGTQAVATRDYTAIADIIKEHIEEKYSKFNLDLEEKLIATAEADKREKRKKYEKDKDLQRKKLEVKQELFRKKLEEEKRKNDLKERAIKLKEEENKRKMLKNEDKKHS